MQELFKRARVSLICATIALTAFIYFGVFNPMKNELENSIIDNYIQLVNSKYYSFNQLIESSKEGAQSLASRTMIRNKISEYLNQEITFDELIIYTQPKYEDGAKILNHLMIAQRMVEQKVVASYMNEKNNKGLELHEKSLINDMSSTDMSSTIEYVNQKILLNVSVPITLENKRLGYDFLVYNLTDELEVLSDDTYQVQLITSQQYNAFLKNMKHMRTEDKVMLYESNDRVFAFIKLQRENYFVVEIIKARLFYTVQRLVARIIILWIVVFGFLFALIYLYVVRFANKEIEIIKTSRDKYKGLAYKDKMTDTYSKAFLEVWKTTLRSEADYFTMIIIDIDNFKAVNDQYGHLTGDEVLKAVAKALYNSIREGDFVIRFGGDEFLVLLKNIKENDASQIMSRIMDSIVGINQFNFKINLSYGMSMIALEDNFNQKFKIADNQMYNAKQKKKQAN